MLKADIVREAGTSIELFVQVTPDAATAAVVVETPLGVHTAVGASKRHPKDEPDNDLAAALAMSRAFDHIAEQFREYAEERIQ